jgi:hypothetical protein
LINLQNINEDPPEEIEEEESYEEDYSQEAWDLDIEDSRRMRELESERERIGRRI